MSLEARRSLQGHITSLYLNPYGKPIGLKTSTSNRKPDQVNFTLLLERSFKVVNSFERKMPNFKFSYVKKNSCKRQHLILSVLLLPLDE